LILADTLGLASATDCRKKEAAAHRAIADELLAPGRRCDEALRTTTRGTPEEELKKAQERGGRGREARKRPIVRRLYLVDYGSILPSRSRNTA
jgi:hypothetical protein